MKNIVEVCCGGYHDAKMAHRGGADRIELCSALAIGGLTPSHGAFIKSRDDLDIKIVSMIRSRAGGFNYSSDEINTMLLDAEILLKYGSDGIAFGFLDENNNIDKHSTEKIVNLAKKYGKEAVFHRAFDNTKDPFESIEFLISIGVDRILTSGQAVNAYEGIDTIKKLQDQYGDKIQILAGCGVNSQNAKKIIDYCGIYQIHSSCKDYKTDNTTVGKVSYSIYPGEHLMDYDVVSLNKVKELVSLLK